MANILGVAQSGLMAAQVGLQTTGHNIANANTPGFSRQVVLQGAVNAQDSGFGFVGKGTTVVSVQRIYSQYLTNNVLASQTDKSQLDSYYSQITQINNLLADPTAGVSPALQDFFSGVQAVSANPNDAASRQSLLSAGQSLTNRFQSVEGQLADMQQGVNTQIISKVDTINVYAKQIATLNDAIEKAQGGTDDKPANDLLDQRDQVIADLSKEVKVSIVKQGESYNVFIGNGQQLVVGNKASNLVTTVSPTDPTRMEIGYNQNGTVVQVAESSLSGGGAIGGLFDFRANTLDVAQNSLGRVAIGLATTVNAQHRLGQDQQGALGGDFFVAASPVVSASTKNLGTGVMTASISDVSALTTSDYRVRYDSATTSYTVTRLSDGAATTVASFPKTIDGVDFNLQSGVVSNGDEFLVRPTVDGAGKFAMAITDKSKIAVAAPIRTDATSTNTGTAKISAGVMNATTLTSAVTLNFNSGTGMLSGFPAGLPITVTSGGVPTTYAAGTANVPYAAGDTVNFGGVDVSGIPAVTAAYTVGPVTSTLTYNAAGNVLSGFPPYLDVAVTSNGTTTTYPAGTPVTYTPPADTTVSYGGVSFTLSGTPSDNDTFTVSANSSGVGDNRNALLLGALQNSNTLDNGTSSYQGAYAQLVNTIGNKTHELQVTSAAVGQQYTAAVDAQQSESGVNLDEEAANMIRYQQAYQAAAKLMQTASTLFDSLLTLGQ